MKPNIILCVILLSFYSFQIKAEPVKNDLRVTLQSSVISLDPGGIQDSQSLFVSRQVNCQLVRNEGAFFVLEAAESIKYITPLRIILKVNKNAKFHDGTPVRAVDIVSSLDYIKKSRNIFTNFFEWIDKTKIIDDATIVFELKKEIPQFLKVLASTNYTIYKKDFLDKAEKDKSLWKKPLGCGGYEVVEFNNRRIRLIPVSYGLPITFSIIKSNQIDSNNLDYYDIVSVNLTGESRKLKDFNLIEMFDPIQYFIGLNSRSKIWRDGADRCHFLTEIDIKKLLDSYGDSALAASDFLPKGSLGYNLNGNFNDQIHNLAKNYQKPKYTKIAKPFCLSYLSVSIQEKNEKQFIDMIKKVHPDLKVNKISNVKKFGKKFLNSSCDALLFGLKTNYYDGYEYLTIFENNDANFSGINNKKLSNKILKSQDIVNSKDRAQEYQSIVKEIGSYCVVRPLFTLATKKIYIRVSIKAPKIGLVSLHQYYLGNISR